MKTFWQKKDNLLIKMQHEDLLYENISHRDNE